MQIRLATINDLPALVNIYNQAIRSGKTADLEPFTPAKRIAWFESHNPEKYPLFVAEESGEICGYISISAHRPGRQALRYTAEVSYYIHEDYFRRGIGSALLEHALKACPVLEIKTFTTLLLENNTESIALLKKFGFSKWGLLPAVADFDQVEVGQAIYGKRITEYEGSLEYE